MRQSVPSHHKDVIRHGVDTWYPLSEASQQSVSDGVLTVKGQQRHSVIATNLATVDTGKRYRVSFHLTSVESGKIRIELGEAFTAWHSEPGVYTENVVATGPEIKVVANPEFKGTIDLGKTSIRMT